MDAKEGLGLNDWPSQGTRHISLGERFEFSPFLWSGMRASSRDGKKGRCFCFCKNVITCASSVCKFVSASDCSGLSHEALSCLRLENSSFCRASSPLRRGLNRGMGQRPHRLCQRGNAERQWTICMNNWRRPGGTGRCGKHRSSSSEGQWQGSPWPPQVWGRSPRICNMSLLGALGMV